MVAAGGCREKTVGYVEKYFGSSGGAAATEIRQVWRERGMRGGVSLMQRWVREGRGMGFRNAGTETGDAQVGT